MRSAAFGSVGVRPRQIADSTRPNSRNSRQAPRPVIADFCNKIGPKRKCRNAFDLVVIGGKADLTRTSKFGRN